MPHPSQFPVPRPARCAATLLLIACCVCSGSVQGGANVVVILVDDLGWTDLSCQGSTYYQTPNIDRLAAEGVRFTNGYAACAVCSPTRAAYLTGRYPVRTGITDWIRPPHTQGKEEWTEADRPPLYQENPRRPLRCPENGRWLELDEVTLAEELRREGYKTAHVGKWHLGDRTWHPETQGYDVNIAGCDLGQPPSYFDPYVRKDQKRNVFLSIPTLSPRKTGEYLTDREADEAVSFIKENHGEPFFLSLCHYAVHTPIQAKEEITAEYRKTKDPQGLQDNPVYAAMVHSVDDAVGRVLDTLDELELADQTLVIFTSDNGGLRSKTNNSPLRNGKGSPYEGGIRVPWIIRWPGASKRGAVSDEPIITCDIKPTVLDATGVRGADDKPIDGVSLRPIFESDNGKLAERPLFWFFPHYRYQDWKPYAIIRKGPLKLIYWFENSVTELFDLEEDLGEKKNLAGTQAETAGRLEKELQAWLRSTGARVPIPKDQPLPN